MTEDWDPTLVAILRAGLASYFSDSSFDSGHFTDSTYHHLIESQCAIGWDHFIRGKWSTEWARLQYEYKQATSRTYKSDPVVTMIRLLWDQVHTLWLERNGKRHGTDTTSREVAQRSAMRREITHLYSLSLPPADETLHRPLDLHVLLDESLVHQRDWLTTRRRAIKAAHKSHVRSSAHNTDRLETYFESRGRSRGRGIRVPQRQRRVRLSAEEQILRSTTNTPHITTFIPVVAIRRAACSTDADDHSTVPPHDALPLTRPVQRPLTAFFPTIDSGPSRRTVNLHPDHPG